MWWRELYCSIIYYSIQAYAHYAAFFDLFSIVFQNQNFLRIRVFYGNSEIAKMGKGECINNWRLREL